VPIGSTILLLVALACLTAGAELLVRGSVALAQRIGISSFFIGMTIVGFGTSAPELAASVTAAMRGHTDINVGNVVGSNICNIALILGLTAIIAPIAVHRRIVRVELWILLLVSAVPFVAIFTGGVLTRLMAIVMLIGLGFTIWRGYLMGRAEGADQDDGIGQIAQSMPEPTPRAWRNYATVHLTAIILGLSVLIVGSHLLVDSAVTIARELGMSELVIGLTIVALGTSAPELVTSIVAAARRQSDLSVGNIFGSNIFNILGILSVSAIIAPQTLSAQVFRLDLPVMFLLTVVCLPIMLTGRRIARGEGTLLVIAYAGYVTVLLTVAPAWFGNS
jgi:cation:H+ antiporter